MQVFEVGDLQLFGLQNYNIFNLSPQYIVFLNGWDAVKDAFSQVIDRPPTLFEKVPFNFGIDGANGEEWVQTRRFSSKAMKDIGLNNTVWEQLVQDEASKLVKDIIEQGNQPVNVHKLFRYNIANNIVTLIFGKRLHTGHSFTKTVTDAVDTVLQNTATLGMANFSPTLSKILEMLRLEKSLSLPKTLYEFRNFLSNIVDDVIQTSDSEKDDSFIVRFQREVDIHRNNKEKIFITEDSIKGTVIAMLAGGSETTYSTINFTLIAMAEHQDKQRRVHEELDGVIGKEGSFRWSERSKIPYTCATLMESMRWATVVPFTTMRIATEDIKIQGYDIPKGTFLTANTYSVHNDPKYWRAPHHFMPERFLLEDGRKVNTAPESFIPFSFGKRICPGKLMAQMEILQYFCILMQNFKVAPEEGSSVNYGTFLGLTYYATDVELRFIPR